MVQHYPIVLANVQDASHFRFSIRNALMLLADCLYALRKDEQAFVYARRFDHAVLAVISPSIVF